MQIQINQTIIVRKFLNFPRLFSSKYKKNIIVQYKKSKMNDDIQKKLVNFLFIITKCLVIC